MTIDPARYDGHNRGPWCVSQQEFSDWGMIRDSDGYAVANACMRNNYTAEQAERCRAEANVSPKPMPGRVGPNARLIADAPMLLDKVLELQAENERLENLAVDRGTEIDNLETEIVRLRSLIPVWVTVTEDPATLPDPDKLIAVDPCPEIDDECYDCRVGLDIVTLIGPRSMANENDWPHWQQTRSPRDAYDVLPGDRWCYVPTPDPKVANSQPLTPDQTIPDTTDRENRASESHISKESPMSQWIVAFTDGRNGSVLAQSFDFREQSADIVFRNGDGVVCILPTSIITSIISSDPENGDQTYHA